jgi:hypothetical protein
MLYDYVERQVEAPAKRNKTIILLRVSTGPQPPKGGKGAAQGFRQATPRPVLFGLTERNKMTEVLLR